MTLAQDTGLTVDTGPLSKEQLFAADEVFLTGTAAELVGVASVDDHVYPKSRPITEKLHAAYRRATKGEDPKHKDWVTNV